MDSKAKEILEEIDRIPKKKVNSIEYGQDDCIDYQKDLDDSEWVIALNGNK